MRIKFATTRLQAFFADADVGDDDELLVLMVMMEVMVGQTWNLSKNLHRRIFRLKILHRQLHLISTVLVGKKTQKMSKNGEIYTAASSNGMDKFHL